MKNILNTLHLAMLLQAISLPWALAQENEYLYAGTFSERGSMGIYVFQLDSETGTLQSVQTVPGKESPSFLALDGDCTRLYAVHREGTAAAPEQGTVTAYGINPQNGTLHKINELPGGGASPCHISLDPKGRYAYISHYADGTFSVIALRKDGSLDRITDVARHRGSSVNPGRQDGPHVHAAVPSKNGKFVYVADLGIDKVTVYSIDDAGKAIAESETAVKPGSGPRHFTLHPNGKFAYLAEELSSSVSCYTVDKKTGALSYMQRLSTLPPFFTGTNSVADIHTDQSGEFLYVSNRGHNSLAIYRIDKKSGELTHLGNADVKGERPRNFLIHPKGQLAFVANRDTDEITVFKRDNETGLLIFTGQRVTVPGVVCLVVGRTGK